MLITAQAQLAYPCKTPRLCTYARPEATSCRHSSTMSCASNPNPALQPSAELTA